MARVDTEQRTATLARLAALRGSGTLTSQHVRLAATGLGVAERTVWRWLRATSEPGPDAVIGRPAYQLTDTDRDAFAHFRGSVAAVHRAREAVISGAGKVAGLTVPEELITGWTGAEPVALRTLQAAFARELTPAERAAFTDGEHARRAADVYLTRSATSRNQAWETDHKQLPILVLPPRGPAVRPRVTTVIDDGTRALVGWALAITPHTGTVLTALRMALVHDPARGLFGGVPALVRMDRGLDFAAEAVRDVLAALCVQPHRLPARQPHRKGKVERLNLTIEQTFLIGMPGYTDGPRDAAGQLYGPISDNPTARTAAQDDVVGPVRIERFAAQFAEWVSWYNTERPHSMLHVRTPIQASQDDPAPVHRVEQDTLRHLLLAGVERVIGKDGIRFNNLAYIASELQGRGISHASWPIC